MKNEDILDLYDLLIEQLRDLYDGEQQQLNVLPKFDRKAVAPELEEVIAFHVRETKHHVQRLEEAFDILEEEPAGESCEGIHGLIREAIKLTDRCKIPEVIDAALITSIQHINHYEIAGYGTAISYAKALDLHQVAEILLETLREEKNADKNLSSLAEDHINVDATWTSLVSKIKS
ncbi:MAG: ferritin-like domain-containing protein [Bacteroidota bacterium]